MRPASAQRIEAFEGGEPRWTLVDSDCQAQLTEHSISLIMPHGGRTCELAEVACGTGTMVLLAYPVEPALVLDEFQPQMWTRCSSGRLQLGVRVVFPFDEHPVTQGRLTTILWGSLYTETGQWQQLRVEKLQKLLNDEIISLRQRFGSHLKLDGAYIDCLVLNAYTGPGRYRVQMDDLDLRSAIPVSATGMRPPEDWRARWQWRHAVPSAEERFWAGPNRIPLWLQYQGESLPWLRSLGVTGLLLNKLPSEEQLAKLQSADLSAICPPPSHPVEIADNLAPVIQGWLVGAALDGKQADLARQQADRVAALEHKLARPLVGEALEQYWNFSRIADEVIVPVPDPNSAGSEASKQAWLSRKLATVRQRGQGWVSINAGLSPAIDEQYQQALAVVDPELALQAEPVINPLGMRLQAVKAVAAGARGILFRTQKPLAVHSSTERATVAALRWMNNEMNLWGPWLATGQLAANPALDRSDFAAKSWVVSESYLVIAHTSGKDSQYCVPPTQGQALQVSLSTPSVPMQVLRLTEGRMESLKSQRTPAGVTWAVEKPAAVESFVITANSLILNYVRRELEKSAKSNAADQMEVVAFTQGIAANLIQARFGTGGQPVESQPEARRQLQQLELAQRQLTQSAQALQTNQPAGSTVLSLAASENIQSILFDAQQVATSNLSTPQSSPFVVSPATLHVHWQLADASARSTWHAVPLPGGSFSNLSEMLDVGWTQQRRLEEQVDLRVELVPARDDRTGAGLRLAAYQKSTREHSPAEELEGGYEGASLRVRSAGAKIDRGQLVRVSAQARVLRATRGLDSGLLVYDNQAGPSLGQLIQGNVGDVVPVELYRFMVSGDEFRLLSECRGECDIVLENIIFSAITPAHNRRSFVTSPLSMFPDEIVPADASPQP
ncbi:hypothetical protein [Aureliella helgolandensis]|nr:hypothetical protein [Aureliella helgolandensis]